MSCCTACILERKQTSSWLAVCYSAVVFHPRMPNISYSFKTKRLAVGARSGQVGLYDLKQGRTQVRTCDIASFPVLPTPAFVSQPWRKSDSTAAR